MFLLSIFCIPHKQLRCSVPSCCNIICIWFPRTRSNRSSKSKITHFNNSWFTNQNIFWLDITMNDLQKKEIIKYLCYHIINYICTGKTWAAIDRLSTIYKSDICDKIQWELFQAQAVSVLLYSYTIWTQMKHLEFNGNCPRMLHAVLNK